MAAACMLTMLQSCMPGIQVDVDAISAPEGKYRNCYVIVPDEPTTTESPCYEQFCGYLDNALQDEGFVKASSPENANVEILFSYGISERSYLVADRFSKLTREESARQGAIALEEFKKNQELCPKTGRLCNPYDKLSDFQGGLTVQEVYKCFFKLRARDLIAQRKMNRPKQVWSLKALAIVDQNAMERVVPMMIAATKNKFATSTDGTVSVIVDEEESSVLQIKNGH